MSNYWKKKMDELEEEEKKTTSQSYWDRKTASFDKEWKTSEIVRSAHKDDDEDDIAPIKSTKEEKGLFDFFQKGAFEGFDIGKRFEDGYQFGDISKTYGEILQRNTKATLGTVADAGMNAVKGVVGIGEGIGDLISYGVAGVADKMGEDAFARGVRQKAKENLFDNLLKPAEDYLDKYSILGRTSDSIMQGVGQVGAIMATGGLGSAAGLGEVGVTALTTGLMGVSGAGSGMSEAYRGGANDLQAFKHGLNSGAADALSELIFGGLGKSLNAVGFSKGLSSADDLLAKLASSKLKNQAAKNIVEFGIKAGAEGLEEVIAGVAQAYSKYHNYLNEQGMDFADVLKDENLLEQFIVGSLTSGVVQAPGLNIANKTGTDFITGRTQNEQAVVDKEVENRIAEAEEDGTKLTAKEKTAIQEQVEKDLEKGYISTDLIEEVVGGDTFKTYKSYLDEETKLQQEFDTLNKKKQGDMTGEQMDRRTELKDLLAEIKEKPKSQQLRMTLDQEVSESIKGSRLMESYNERTRREQAFEADLTRYDEKQKAVIQKAIDSGILNNTNRTHEFVDMVAKISADKGVLFDFTNNEKLKTSAFAVDGKAVNGFVTKDGITINMQSAKALNTIVGHEITHVLEGTDLYTELQNAVVEYAKTKGDYQGRFDSLSKLYEAVEGADIHAELTADLVGDYLFTDPDFINNLSTKHRNVFQKIYDEVKYLLKVARAGSKEARQLEKVKRAFEKAYREGENARESEEISDSKTKYSIREEAPPKNTGVAYKVFFVKDGKLYPPMVANPGGADTPMGVWLNADMGTAAPASKTGRAQVKAGGKGTQGGGGSLAFRPGWHLGDLPRASQFDRVNPETGNKELFPENFVWAEVEYAKDVDYQEEAMSYGYTDNGKFRHAYAGLPRLPENGYYRYRTNPKPDTVPWVITGAMKVNRLLSDAEVNAILEKNGVPPVHRQGGDVGLDKFGFKEDGTVQYSLSDSDGRQLSLEQQEFFKDSKAVDDKGQLLVLYHGTSEDFTVFDKNRIGQNFQNRGGDLGFYFSPYFDEAAGYAKNAGGKRVESVYLNLTNPLIVEDEGWGSAIDQADVRHNDLMRWAKNGKHDGIIVKSTDYEMEDGTVDAVYIAFNPEQIKRVDNKNPTFSNDIRYSLSAEQQEFFKDSVVRDKDGNLKVMYHGTSRGGHTMFDPYGKAKYGLFGLGTYFTDNKEVAQSYTTKGKGTSPQVYETYLNITNPMDMDAAADPKQWQKAFPEAQFPESGTNEQFYRAMEEYFEDNEYVRWEAEEEAMDAIMGMGYDGITHIGGGRFNKADDTRHRVYIAFRPEQIKDVGNQKPTSDPDIRYSLSQDSDGNKLTEAQQEYFRSSKMRDDNGNLKVMYHGSQNGGFHVFDPNYSEDSASLFFVDRNSVAESYSGTSETYAAQSFKTAEDFNRFFAGIGAEEYEVKEADGKFHLYEDGDVVAESDTAEGIYEEFRDWSGKGYGNVNYKVYLDLVNPFIVDAKGAEWNGLPNIQGEDAKYEYIKLLSYNPDNNTYTIEYAMTGDPAPQTKDVVLFADFDDGVSTQLENLGLGEELRDVPAKPNTTRDYADYARKNGYDGVILKNIVDVGGYGGDYAPATVAIAFDSSQVKSVANENPTTNKDIRYSLSNDDLEYAYNYNLKVGEMDGAQMVVEQAAKNAGYTIEGYHGTDRDFWTFSLENRGRNGEMLGVGYYFTNDRDKATMYSGKTGKVKHVFLDIKKPTSHELMNITEKEWTKFLDYTEQHRDEYIDGVWKGNSVNKDFEVRDMRFYSSDSDLIKSFIDSTAGRNATVAEGYLKMLKDSIGYDGLIYENGDAKVYVAFTPEQIKSADTVTYDDDGNMIPLSERFDLGKKDIRYSASEKGKPYGRYNVYSKDVLLETAPVQEEVAPTVSEMETTTEEPVAPVPANDQQVTGELTTEDSSAVEDLFPDDLAPVETEIARLEDEKAALEVKLLGLGEAEEFGEEFTSLSAEWGELDARIKELQAQENEKFDSLTDADAPPEMEAPMHIDDAYPDSQSGNVEDPFAERDIVDVGNRKVKAYQYENPEVKPFFYDAALGLAYDVANSTHGERFYNDQVYYDSGGEKGWMGTKRSTSPDIANFKDTWKCTWDELAEAVNDIIEDNGKENNALSKRVEFLLNDRLLYGYTDFEGRPYPPSQEYIDFLKEKEITEYSSEAFEKLLATADQYAPPAEPEPIGPSPMAPTETVNYGPMKGQETYITTEDKLKDRPPQQGVDDIAPLFDAAGNGVPEGQQAFLEPDAKADAIAKQFAKKRASLREEYLRTRAEKQNAVKDKNAFISSRAMELYQEIRGLKKGVKASEAIGYLLDHGYEWGAIRSALVNIRYTPDRTINQNSVIENIAREMLANEYENKVYELDELDAEYKRNVEQLEADAQKALNGESLEKFTRKQLHENIVGNIKATFEENGFDFEKVLQNAKNLSTFATVDNTPQRVMEKALGYKEGGILADITVNQVAHNETKGIQWLNSFTDRKNGLLAKLSKQYGIKPGSKESAAAQMYAEGFYVTEKNEIVKYGDAELAKDFPDAAKQAQIKGLARDKSIRQIYDDTLKAINESRTRNAYPEIPRLDNYFLHFRAQTDTFSRLGIPFNPNDIRAKDLPTDLNGVTADLKPGQPFFASAMHREGKRTDFDLLGGLEQYLTSAKNQIYHIDDIQTLRALRNYIADTYGQANGLSDLDSLSEEEAQERIKEVYGSHLSTFAKFLNEEANVLAGKTALIDRGVEGIIGRRGITFLDTVNKQVGKNMVGFNVSSSMTNFLSVVQAFAKANKFDFVKALSQTAASKLKALGGVTDSFVENNPTIIRRKGAEKFFKTPYEKVSDEGYFLMSAVDNLSTEIIVRAKYNELTRKGMDQQKAAFEADKWVSRLMGDRSLGQQPQLYNSKMLGLLTKFQLEVRNQLDSQFYDTIQEAKVSSEHIENRLLRNAKTAAKVGSTFFQLAVLQHVFGKAFESVAGYNPAFDIIEALVAAFGWDDDEEDEDTVLDNIEEGFMVLLEDLPYSSTFTGGRIPISSALPVKQFITGKDQYGNEKSRWETLAEAAPYFVAPGGYGQLKKTVAGLKMFSDDHPIAGSYTDSGNLRFPVEDTLGNRVQAAVFGQWASGNARDYFDNERKALTPKQTKELIDVGISIQDYWKYREGLSGLNTLEQKLFYIDSLNLTTAQKNVLANNLTDRKEPIDMSDYDQFDSLAEFDYANNNPEKYAFFEKIGITYEQYQNADDESKDAYDWAFKNPEKYTMSKAVSDDYLTFWQYKSDMSKLDAKDENGETVNGLKKERVIDYINNLDMDYGQRIILYRSMYNSQADRDDYNSDILDYLNSRDDLSYAEKVSILKELDFTVTDDGDVYWE